MKNSISEISPYARRPLSRQRATGRSRYTSSLILRPAAAFCLEAVGNYSEEQDSILGSGSDTERSSNIVPLSNKTVSSKALAEVVSLFPEL